MAQIISIAMKANNCGQLAIGWKQSKKNINYALSYAKFVVVDVCVRNDDLYKLCTIKKLPYIVMDTVHIRKALNRASSSNHFAITVCGKNIDLSFLTTTRSKWRKSIKSAN